MDLACPCKPALALLQRPVVTVCVQYCVQLALRHASEARAHADTLRVQAASAQEHAQELAQSQAALRALQQQAAQQETLLQAIIVLGDMEARTVVTSAAAGSKGGQEEEVSRAHRPMQ